MVALGSTSAMTVGSTKYPRSPTRLPPVDQATLGFTALDVSHNRLEGSFVDHRTHIVSRVARVADRNSAHAASQFVDELVVDSFFDDRARARGAFLSLEAKRRNRDPFDGCVDIRVGGDNDRVLPAHLGDDAFDPFLPGLRRGRQLVDAQAYFFGTGERNEANLRMRNDRIADLAARAGNKVHNARRYSDLVQKVDEPSGNDRGIARRFEHDGVTANDCRRGHADHDGAGEVPRRDYRPHAKRNIHQLVSFALERHDGLRLGVTKCLARVELDEVDCLTNVAIGLGPALANFVNQERIVNKAPGPQQLGHLKKVGGALRERAMAPRFERASRRFNRFYRLLLRCGAGDADHFLGIGRIERPDLLLGFDFAPVDHERIMLSEVRFHRVERRYHCGGVRRIAEVFHPFVSKGRDFERGLRGCRRHTIIVPGEIAWALCVDRGGSLAVERKRIS